jgi:hypothetical protein
MKWDKKIIDDDINRINTIYNSDNININDNYSPFSLNVYI